MIYRLFAIAAFVASLTIGALALPLAAYAQDESSTTTEAPKEGESGDEGSSVKLAEPDC